MFYRLEISYRVPNIGIPETGTYFADAADEVAAGNLVRARLADMQPEVLSVVGVDQAEIGRHGVFTAPA